MQAFICILCYKAIFPLEQIENAPLATGTVANIFIHLEDTFCKREALVVSFNAIWHWM